MQVGHPGRWVEAAQVPFGAAVGDSFQIPIAPRRPESARQRSIDEPVHHVERTLLELAAIRRIARGSMRSRQSRCSTATPASRKKSAAPESASRFSRTLQLHPTPAQSGDSLRSGRSSFSPSTRVRIGLLVGFGAGSLAQTRWSSLPSRRHIARSNAGAIAPRRRQQASHRERTLVADGTVGSLFMLFSRAAAAAPGTFDAIDRDSESNWRVESFGWDRGCQLSRPCVDSVAR